VLCTERGADVTPLLGLMTLARQNLAKSEKSVTFQSEAMYQSLIGTWKQMVFPITSVFLALYAFGEQFSQTRHMCAHVLLYVSLSLLLLLLMAHSNQAVALLVALL